MEAHDSDVGNENSGMANQWLSGALTAFDPIGDILHFGEGYTIPMCFFLEI